MAGKGAIPSGFILRPSRARAYSVLPNSVIHSHPLIMKKRFRTFIVAATGLALCACANPYADQIASLDARYAAGKMSRREYIAERDYLSVQKAQVDRENVRTGLAAAAIGTAIAGTVVASQQDHGRTVPAQRGRGGGPPR